MIQFIFKWCSITHFRASLIQIKDKQLNIGVEIFQDIKRKYNLSIYLPLYILGDTLSTGLCYLTKWVVCLPRVSLVSSEFPFKYNPPQISQLPPRGTENGHYASVAVSCHLSRSTLRWRHNGRDCVSNTSLTIVYSAVYSGADQIKHQVYASLAFVWGIPRGPMNSPHKWPVTRKCFHLMTSSWDTSQWLVEEQCITNEQLCLISSIMDTVGTLFWIVLYSTGQVLPYLSWSSLCIAVKLPVWQVQTSESQLSTTWGGKCLALIAQIVRALGMNPKFRGSSPLQVETFSVSKTLTL